MKILLQHFLGYFQIRVEGFFVERVINKAIEQKIPFWRIKREKSTIIYANVAISKYEELLKIVAENQCNIEKLKEVGLPSIIKRYKKRKILIIILISILGMLLISSRFIWNIQLEGLQSIDKAELKEELKVYGLKIGMPKRNLKTDDIINKIRLNRKDISWIGIEISRNKCSCKSSRSRDKTRNN